MHFLETALDLRGKCKGLLKYVEHMNNRRARKCWANVLFIHSDQYFGMVKGSFMSYIMRDAALFSTKIPSALFRHAASACFSLRFYTPLRDVFCVTLPI